MTDFMLNKQETLNEIGAQIRKLREKKNLSIQDFADKLEMEYNNVIRIEKGRTNFTIGTLVKIANTLEVNLKDIV
ncbi:helix-turn-helix domain-containing protein [Bacteroides congonensis]|uniref:helix-turn-helix domain-containing protein n=2 Tax=Bacteroides congonensis TaxID=1871006 RepID=UPI000934658F|nr:helix-turn-helix transcriptional regulator [Bacteroides congonensis]